MYDRNVVILSAVRTPVGRLGGALKDITPQELGALVVQEALNRAGVPAFEVDEVIIGQSRQTTEASNIARVIALRTEIPEEVPAYTVHRQCASSLQAFVNGCQEVLTGCAEVVVTGGTEVLSRAPFYLKNARYGYGNGNGVLVDSLTEAGPGAQPIEKYGHLPMGLTAENVAREFNISREDQDRFALLSQQRAARAITGGCFKQQIIPVQIKAGKQTVIFDTDEYPRETTLEKLAVLPPSFVKDGTVTAGNSCGFNDGAGALVIASGTKAAALGLKPLARVVSWSAVGVSPRIMGIGPVPATRKALARGRLTLDDIGLVELNEAFAAQVLASLRELGLAEDKVNPYGGAIALGHPIGATGAVLLTKLVHGMLDRDGRYGLATLCIGGGQGMAVILEKIG
ncbi:acetyl-CoA acetyltransferase [Clostridiales bacterium PH28_bin88]|nr:acetyl-CoA acetyltransferase [Clostridiales bacterium PH28_bin88]